MANPVTSAVLVDTSAWIEAMRPHGDPSVRARVEALLMDGRAVLCHLVTLELWNGARGDSERRWLAALESDLEVIPTTPKVWASACELARGCRKAGVTVPATDLLIAACARSRGLVLLHRDQHFERIDAAVPPPAPARD